MTDKLTPEDRAIQVWLSIDLNTHHGDEICAAIADAIRAAVAAEREACAKLADQYWGGGMPEDAIGESVLSASYDIAAAIRARSEGAGG